MQGLGDGEIQTNSAIEETLEDEDSGLHWYTISSGRTFAWPFVIEKIADRPFAGYGRNAMQRTGVASMLLLDYGESFPHPHNAYLEWIMDNGFLGAIPVFVLFGVFIRRAKVLFEDDSDHTFVAVGGMCLALTLAFLIAGIGSQTFYPREGAVGMWCAIGLMLRVYMQRQKMLALRQPATTGKPEVAAQ
jgi:O-antigen ligase